LDLVYLERESTHDRGETADEKDDDGCCIKKWSKQSRRERIESLSDNKTRIAYMTKADERDRGR